MSESQFTGQPEVNPTVAPVTPSCPPCAEGESCPECTETQGPELSADTDTEPTSEPSPE